MNLEMVVRTARIADYAFCLAQSVGAFFFADQRKETIQFKFMGIVVAEVPTSAPDFLVAGNSSEAVPRVSASLCGTLGIKFWIFLWEIESKVGVLSIVRSNRGVGFAALILVPVFGDEKC